MHVVPGNSLVIGDSLIVDERALAEIRNCHNYPAWSFAIGCACLVVSGIAGLEIRHRLHGDRRARHNAKQLRQLGLHLRDVLAEILDNLPSRHRPVLRIADRR